MSKSIEECHCQKCGNDWWPQRPGRPGACPKCKNTEWDNGPKKPGGRGRTKEKAEAENA